MIPLGALLHSQIAVRQKKKMDWVNNFPFPAKKIDVIFRVIFPMFSMLFIGPIT